MTNLQQLANALPGGGDAPIFTGRCIQRGLNQPGGGRKWVARYMRALAANDTVGARGIAEMMPPSPGGGPGLLFSRGLLLPGDDPTVAATAYYAVCRDARRWRLQRV